MTDFSTQQIQERIYQNKVNKGFNTTDIPKEFCLLYGEVGEAFDAWRKDKSDFIVGCIFMILMLVNTLVFIAK